MAWCQIVSTLHGCHPRMDHQFWGLDQKAPTFYPDVVTKTENVSYEEYLNFTNHRPVEFIKDSFSSLQLPEGEYSVLFNAHWIYHAPVKSGSQKAVKYRPVSSTEDLRLWTTTHGSGDVFTSGILSHPDVTFYANKGDHIESGFIVNVHENTVGVFNVFSTKISSSLWTDIIQSVSQNHECLHIVGYEQDKDYENAIRAGWENIGDLRVWMKN
ncbi:hypothetical protein EV207_10788 [Scopulibacillus darangshiensis]|uniref:Uncharacterized protein n=2 Tax=Scopulibacillus darangshiensis TaxID=442528 RepID=A0A4R2P748_9BACL|nr:hypothetical protein EV207_10788 [Scopulibacillus darangshiensis]